MEQILRSEIETSTEPLNGINAAQSFGVPSCNRRRGGKIGEVWQ
jgi:hypothetical protein